VSQAAAKRRVTYAEYLAAEASSEQRHEFIAGEVIAMAGGTIEHGRLMSSLTRLLSAALLLAAKPCVVLPADVRVRIRAADRATYPDHVVCGDIARDPDDPNAVVNPIVIVEVLSDSTADTDRSEKFADYRKLGSLREYVLVSQRERRVEIYRRDGRRWVLDEYGRTERFSIAALDVELAVDEIYTDGLGAIVG
jgi:Uma2 family endonuclease